MTSLKTPKDRYDELVAELKALVEKAEAEGRDLTDEEVAEAEGKSAEIAELKAKFERAAKSDAIMALLKNDPDEVEDLRTGHTYTRSSGRKLALTGRHAKAAAENIAPQIHAAQRKTYLAPGTSELFAIPVQPDIVELQTVPTSILELLPTTQHDVPVWEYLRQTAFVNNAVIVAPGAEKPTSEVTLAKVRNQLSVIAHLTEPVDKYLLEDYDQLVSFISGQMIAGLGRKLEEYVLSGDGTDSNGDPGGIVGLLNTSGVQTQAYDASVDKITALRLAATRLEVIGYTPGAYVLNTNDWAQIETTRNTSGAFDLAGPVDRAERKAWGTQVTTSPNIPAGTALALDLSAAVVDTDSAGVRVEWDKSQGFTRNEILGRVEGRFGLSVPRPDGIVKIALAED